MWVVADEQQKTEKNTDRRVRSVGEASEKYLKKVGRWASERWASENWASENGRVKNTWTILGNEGVEWWCGV